MYLVFDIGGTRMRVAVSEDGISFKGNPRIEPTPQDFEEGVQLFLSLAKEVLLGQTPTHIAGGIAGILDSAGRVYPPYLPHWTGKNIAERFASDFGIPVSLVNDAALAALGEAHKGAGTGKNIVAYLTLSTGIGGARVVDGRIDKSAFGFEPGHQIIMQGEDAVQTLEELVSGSALKAMYGKAPEAIDDPTVWKTAALHAGLGVINTIAYWSPDIVVLGGGLMNKISIEDVRTHVKQRMTIFPELPIIENAALGDSAGLTGALLYLQSQ